MKHYDDLILILVCFGIFFYIVCWFRSLRESFGGAGGFAGGGFSKFKFPKIPIPTTVPTTVPTTIPTTVPLVSGTVFRSGSSKQMQNIEDVNLNFSNNETTINNKLNNNQVKIDRIKNSIQNINQPNLNFSNNDPEIDNKLNNNITNINTVKNSRENTRTAIKNVSDTDLKVDNKQEISNAISSIETEQQAIDSEILDFENKIQTKYKKLFG